MKLVDFDITVQKGQRINFENTSQSQHEVLIDGGRVDSSPMQPGSMFTWTPDQAGKLTLSCKIHPNQMGPPSPSSSNARFPAYPSISATCPVWFSACLFKYRDFPNKVSIGFHREVHGKRGELADASSLN